MARCRQWGRLGVAAMVVVLAVPRCLAQVLVDAAETSGYPGWTVPLSVSHGANGAAPSSVGLALFFSDPRNVNVVANSDGRPDCSAHEAVSTPGQFVFWPVGCRYEDDECDTVRAPFVDLSGAQPNLPSGELFRCTVRIAGSASPGTYPVRVIDPDAAAQNGVTVTASADDGVVHVLQPPGGGGCMIDPTNRGTAVWFALLALLVGAGARSARTRR
ncbi:MAG: hypothetical protein N3C12_14615 [Candidatus Binatia bacterium]|nr:hypothetical protein [Candidatus Binatia bacterium]